MDYKIDENSQLYLGTFGAHFARYVNDRIRQEVGRLNTILRLFHPDKNEICDVKIFTPITSFSGYLLGAD